MGPKKSKISKNHGGAPDPPLATALISLVSMGPIFHNISKKRSSLYYLVLGKVRHFVIGPDFKHIVSNTCNVNKKKQKDRIIKLKKCPFFSQNLFFFSRCLDLFLVDFRGVARPRHPPPPGYGPEW